MRIVTWGTYDKGKPRVRILLNGLRDNNVEIIECHSDIWKGVEDKSSLKGSLKLIGFVMFWLFSYPILIIRYMFLPKHDAVFVGYMGFLDTIVLWPFARLRGVPIVWDAFISIFNTVVEDRCFINRTSIFAYIIYFIEWLSCKASDLIILDTNSHINYFSNNFNIQPSKFTRVFVGVENKVFKPIKRAVTTSKRNKGTKVLFYGQFIPLHGIEYIISAARILQHSKIELTLIGYGQEEKRIRQIISDHPLPNLKWIPWVPYEKLPRWICETDICLGIFGLSQKASQVIPNKVFQILACGKPLITRDSPAIREILSPTMPGVCLIPPGQPDTLAAAILKMAKNINNFSHNSLHQDLIEILTPKAIGNSLINSVKFSLKITT